MHPEVRLEGWLRWFAHSLGSVGCRGHVQSLAFAPKPLFLLQAFKSHS